MRPTLLGLRDDAATAPPASMPPTTTSMDSEIMGFLLKSPQPSSSDVASFLSLYTGADRITCGQALIAHGVDPKAVSNALTWLDASGRWNWNAIGGVLSLASGAVSGYHGYKRNKSIWWSAVWFAAGTVFPIFVPVVAVAQGFSKPKGT